MNKLNYQYPPNPENCCCYCSYKKDCSPRNSRGAKYAESSSKEDDENEDECDNQTFRKNGNAFSRSEMYDNLLHMIDDQMINTMSNLRKKARKFMKSEFEQSFSSDTTDHRCNHSDDTRSKSTNVKKKANEIDYQPQSTFLKKMVQQYQGKQNEFSDLNESDFSAMCEAHNLGGTVVGGPPLDVYSAMDSPSASGSMGVRRNVEKTRDPNDKRKCTKSTGKERKAPSAPGANQTKKSSGPCFCKCSKHDSPNAKEENPQKNFGHVSRLKKKTQSRGNRKRRLSRNCDSGDRFAPDLKQPHENSCERCWRFASPSRSPVNKPDQRYNPNFRRGHSCTNLNTKKAEDATDKKEACASPGRQQSFNKSEIPKNVRPSFTSTPKKTPRKKSNRSQNAPCEDEAQFTPFSKGSAFRSQTFEQSKPGMERFDFEYPSSWLCDTLRSQQQKCAQRPQSRDKLNERSSLEKGIIYSSNMRNLLTRPHSIPAPCNDKEEVENRSCQQYKDVCGRGRLENLDPCIKRNYPAKTADSCQSAEMDMSTLRGDDFGENHENFDGSGELGLDNRLNTNRGSGQNTIGDDFDNLELSEIPIDGLNDSSRRESSAEKSKPGDDRDKTPKKHNKSQHPSTSRNKSPKSKSPKESPLGGSKGKKSPRGSKDRKGGSKKGNCSTNEAQAYFKIPSEPKAPENCGVTHPIRNCQCYPRVINNSLDSEVYCCHCDWKKDANKESRRVGSDEVGRSGRNESCCSTRPALSEPSTFPGRRPSPSQGYNQKPTLPNIDEFPEQLFELTVDGADSSELVIPCPYRLYMSKRPLNNNASVNESRSQRRNSLARNENCSFGDGNISYERENTNLPQGMSMSENYPRYGNGNTSFGNFTMSSQMNPGYGMEYPRKYCVMYMTKGKNEKGDDVEVLVEELSQPCPQEKDVRMTNVKEKMTRLYKCPTESMALRFQKGVPPCCSVPQKSRELYF